MTATTFDVNLDEYQYGFNSPENYAFKAEKGLTEKTVRQISAMKGEPEWMLEYRLRGYQHFLERPMPQWGGRGMLNDLNFDEIYYYIKPMGSDKAFSSWDDVPADIKNTFDRLGIPEAEQKFLAGVGAQYESEVVYHSIIKDLEDKGVLFMDMDAALRDYPDIVKEYFSTIIPIEDNKFAALNTAVWSGGSFIYVPPNVHIDLPLQAYFRINAQNMGQFERTLIIVDKGSYVHYVEGCFLAGARVQTRQGEKAIEQIQVGDEVFTHKGRYRRVYNTMQRPYEGNIYHIRYFGDSGQTLHVTDEHPLLVVRRQKAESRNEQFKTEWLTASEVKPSDYLAIPVPQMESEQTAKTISVPLGKGRPQVTLENITFPFEPDFFRLLGYYYAEGHVDQEHYLTFSFNVNETAYLNDTHELINRYCGKAANENAPRLNGQTIVLSSTLWARAFAMEFGSSIKDKHMPEFIRNAPLNCLAELVRGMWCGDGSYDNKNNKFRFNSISADLAYGFRDALLRLGVAASINYHERDEPRQPMYTVVISTPWNAQFGNIVGQPAPNGRQSGSPFGLDGNYMYVPIRSIEIEPMETTVYNFSVEEDESYVAEGVISHNCTAPTYSTDSLHSAVVEIVVKEGARCRYSTIQNWSHNVYNLVTKRAQAYKNATMEWVDGNLGCLAEGSTVTTPTGIKPIETVEVGEQVLSFDETSGQLCFRPVTAKRFSGHQYVREVAHGERRLHVTDNHPFYSYRYSEDRPKKLGRYELGYVRADQLTEAIIPNTSLDYGQAYPLAKPTLETTFGSYNQYSESFTATRVREARLAVMEETTVELMWLYGLFLGDGNIYRQPSQSGGTRYAKVGFSVPSQDRARAKLMATMNGVLEAMPTERVDGVQLTWNSVELSEFFEKNGFGGTARTKRVPQWVYSTPEEQRLALLAGYLDADGCVIEQKRRLSIKSVNYQLLHDVAKLATTLGLTTRLYTEYEGEREVIIKGVPTTAHGSHRLEIPLDERILPHLSAPFREKIESVHPAKTNFNRQVGRSNIQLPDSVKIVDVNVSEPSAEKVPTWDIEVAGTGNFVSEGFIVHNSKLTMKYPAVWLMEEGAHGEVLSIAFAGKGQLQDAGGKIVHAAPNTSSVITSKSISKNGGRSTYRGLIKVAPNATNSKSNVVCDALILDEASASDTFPYIEIEAQDVSIGHEASVSKVSEEQLFYLMSRGIPEGQAANMIVSGFIEPIVKELPMEYALEMNRLIEMEMEGSVG